MLFAWMLSTLNRYEYISVTDGNKECDRIGLYVKHACHYDFFLLLLLLQCVNSLPPPSPGKPHTEQFINM